MLKKVGLVAVLAALISVVVATTAWGSAKPRALAAATASVKCGKKVTIGVAYPATGPAASLGGPQWDWANFAKKTWNKSHKLKLAFVPGDTQLAGNNPQAVQVSHAFASNKKILAVTGPAGSQEVEDSISAYKGGGLGVVSGSATRVALTRPTTNPTASRETPKGYFFRTVPNDGQQGDNVATFIHKVLKKKNVRIIDDEEAYSQGLAAQVGNDLRAFGATVTTDHISQQNPDYNSVIAAIPSNTQLVYIPWQVPAMAQQFYTQLHANGKKQIVMGSDGTDDPSTFKGAGSYVSGFPVDFSAPALSAFKKSHSGNPETFGLPTYTSVMVNARAVQAACKAGHGKTTRAAIRKRLPKIQLTKAQSLLGFPVVFLGKNHGKFQGPGDMGGSAAFGIYKIQKNGTYARVG
jgi:ABC-type branched-subunit amino acid transport system substrate-binding protein